MAERIDLYTWPTPNGQKIHIALEELALPYRVHPINISNHEQFTPEFLAVNPNNKIPAIVDPLGPDDEPITLFESGAILLYLAEKTQRLLGRSATEKYNIIQWLMFQMGGLGPMLGQAHHFRIYAPERVQYAYDRYSNEAKRLYQVVETQLTKTGAYIAGRDYSIADIACYPWIAKHQNQGIDLVDYPAIRNWCATLEERTAVVKGMSLIQDLRKS